MPNNTVVLEEYAKARSRRIGFLKNYGVTLLFLLPFLAAFLTFFIYPLCYGLYISMTNFKYSIPGGETLHIIKERVDSFIKELNDKYDNKHILLVSHTITVRVMLLSFLNSGVENIYRIKQDNTSLNIVEFRNYGPLIHKLNDTSHIKNNVKINNSALE